MIDVRVDQTSHAWVERLDVFGAVAAELFQWRRGVDESAAAHHFHVQRFHPADLCGLEGAHFGVIRWVVQHARHVGIE